MLVLYPIGSSTDLLTHLVSQKARSPKKAQHCNIKFLFPNKHSVYLHDTPNRGFFKRAQRNFSHGCIRVEKPVDLAEFVLASNTEWDESRIKSSINSRKTRTVHLNQTIPVYVLYFTSWVDNQGNVNFHKDIYGLDQTLLNALRTKRPNVDMATVQ